MVTQKSIEKSITLNRRRGRVAFMSARLAAILASTCRVGPLLLLGFSGAWIGNLTLLEPLCPWFVGAAVISAVAVTWRGIEVMISSPTP